MPLTLTTTDCVPTPMPVGIWKLICVTPTNPYGMPMNCVAACTPPTVTVTFWVGFGRLASGVPDAGAAPVETGGVTDPAPVMNSVPIFPRAAEVVGTGA